MKIQQPIFPVFAAFAVACAPLHAADVTVTNPDHSAYGYSSARASSGGGGGFVSGGSGGGGFGGGGFGGGGFGAGSQGQTRTFYKVSDQNAVSEEKPGAWLGVAISEASEALTSQLRLDPGVGLLVNFVTTNSPAATAGLKENDVLVEFEGQKLVHPAQLRKLVAVRKDGDTVKITYYRGGEKKSAQVKLGTVPPRTDLYGDRQDWDKALYRYKSFVDSFGTSNNELRQLENSLHELQLNQKQMQTDISRSIQDARRAAHDALRNTTNEFIRFGPNAQTLEGIARGFVHVDKDTTLTLAGGANSARTTVRADDTGTYVVVANPRKRLTVHDPAGKILFDGEIETPEQQSAVPKEIWEKVDSMVKKMAASKKDIPRPERHDDL